MAGSQAIRDTITSTEKTRKITGAMELVAASKLGRSQQRMRTSKPYAEKMRNVIGHVAHARSEYRHSFLQTRPLRKVGYVVVSSDRGLCGALNVNLFRQLMLHAQAHQQQGVDAQYAVIGRKGLDFLKAHGGGNVIGHVDDLGDQPSLQRLLGVVKLMLDAYEADDIQALYIVSNTFVNTMTQQPNVAQVLPLPPVEAPELDHPWDYLYEPDATTVLDRVLKRYIESQVYQAVIENIACEQAARMLAMKHATENASDVIDGLNRAYNKARQAAITQELAEIVAGADAV